MTSAFVRGRYFVGDLVATTAASALAAIVAVLAIPPGWPSLAAMLVGMLLGTVLAIPCSLVAGLVLGMIEPMLQIMFGCMLAGMAAAMIGGLEPARDLWTLAVIGVRCGIATSLFFAIADWGLRRWGVE